jgi:hypothetical protein
MFFVKANFRKNLQCITLFKVHFFTKIDIESDYTETKVRSIANYYDIMQEKKAVFTKAFGRFFCEQLTLVIASFIFKSSKVKSSKDVKSQCVLFSSIMS